MNKRLLLPLLCAASSWAATTTAWELNSFQDFLNGSFQGVSLSRDGRLMLAPRLDLVASTDQPAIWSVVVAKDGTVYAGTGHRGHVYRIRGGKAEAIWTASQPEIFSLALDPNGVLYAGTSPDGKIYRIENGKATEYFDPKARYIWSLAIAKDGTLYAGTGDQGKIYRITGPGAGEVYYETGQSHVTSLAENAAGKLLAGTEPNGLLYRVDAKDKAFVLYDSDLPEVRAMVPHPDGSVYVAMLGGSLAKQAQAAQQAAQSMPSTGATPITTITVTADAQKGIEVKPVQDASKGATQPQAAPATAYSPADTTGVEKSALYRIAPDNTVETLWTSKEENAYDLLVRGNQVLISTDINGRIYRLSPDRRITLVTETRESEAVRLVSEGDAVLAATANIGKLFRLGSGNTPSGSYTSPVHDAGTVAPLGPPRLARVRTGRHLPHAVRELARPDPTWSDWSQPAPAPASIASPNARYIQWRADFSGTAEVNSVSVAYLPQNSAPRVTSINVSAQAMPAATPTKAGSTPASTNATFSVTVSDTADSSASTGTSTQVVPKPNGSQLFLVWQAEDADNDKLTYMVEFRGDDEREWKVLKRDLSDAYHMIDGDVLADGRYYFRVTASDSPANPPGQAREHSFTSAPILVDGTPPAVAIAAPRTTANGIELDVTATDKASALRKAEYAIDAGPWIPLISADGVVDGMQESFNIRLPRQPAGEHIVVVRVMDAAHNPGLAKVVLR